MWVIMLALGSGVFVALGCVKAGVATEASILFGFGITFF